MDQTTFEANERLIRGFSHRVLRRIYAAGCRSVELEDVLQEAQIALLIAQRRWDPSTNVPFGAYFYRGLMNHLNRWVKYELRLVTVSLDLENDEGEGTGLHEIIPDNAPSPEDHVIEADYRSKLEDKLSPITRQFLSLLENPPPELVAIFKARMDKAKHFRGQVPAVTAAPKQITATLVFDLMGCSSSVRANIRKELEIKLERINGRI